MTFGNDYNDIDSLKHYVRELERMRDDLSKKLFIEGTRAAELQAKCERLEGENTQLSKLAEEYRLKIPTTAQAMVYMDLLQNYENLQAQCAEMRSALECVNHPEESYNVESLTQYFERRQKLIDKALSTDCGKSRLEREKEARWLIENACENRSAVVRWIDRRDAWLSQK